MHPGRFDQHAPVRPGQPRWGARAAASARLCPAVRRREPRLAAEGLPWRLTAVNAALFVLVRVYCCPRGLLINFSAPRGVLTNSVLFRLALPNRALANHVLAKIVYIYTQLENSVQLTNCNSLIYRRYCKCYHLVGY